MTEVGDAQAIVAGVYASVRRELGVVVVELAGEVDYRALSVLHRVLADAVAQARRPPVVVVVVEAAAFVDATGLGALFRARGRLRERGGVLVLCGCNPRVEKVLRVAGLGRVLPWVPSVPVAAARFGGGQVSGPAARCAAPDRGALGRSGAGEG